jgi:DNA-binding protein YbaB
MQRVQARLAAELYTVTDRRKVLRVTVDGARRIRSVELTPDWQRSLQSQNLTREVKTAYLAACEQASEAAPATYEDAGLGGPAVASADVSLRDFLASVPGASDLMRDLKAETVRAELARGGVVAEFDLRGELRDLEIRSRHATEVDSEQLATDIHRALHECEEMASERRERLVSEFAGDRSLDEKLQENADRLRRRIDELKARLP